MRKLTRPTAVFPPGAPSDSWVLEGPDPTQIRDDTDDGDIDDLAERYHQERGAREVAEAELKTLAADYAAFKARLDETPVCTECVRLEVQVLPNLPDAIWAATDDPPGPIVYEETVDELGVRPGDPVDPDHGQVRP